MKIIYVHCILRNEYRIDPPSYDFHIFTAIIHHLEGLLTSSQFACRLSW